MGSHEPQEDLLRGDQALPAHSAAHLPFTTDCSGFAAMMARWSGAADPTGNGFNGFGNTDTMLAQSHHITQAETQPGDFAVFGLHPSQHMVVLTQSAAGGNGALCVSHGQQGDPVEVPLSEEIVAQPITFLRLMPGGAVPAQGGPNPFCPLDVNGEFGAQTIEALQWKLGVDQDGGFGPNTKMALQRHLGVTATATSARTRSRHCSGTSASARAASGARRRPGPAAQAEREHLLTGGGHGAGSRAGA